MRLFDEFDRVEATPARNQESSFSFLNRISTPWWTTVREQLEAWFSDYAAEADPQKTADLRARFRKKDNRQHLGAWWELYVFALLRALHPASELAIEPAREGSATRPDFCVLGRDEKGAVELWVEAVTSFSGIIDRRSAPGPRDFVLDTINEVQSADFRVSINFKSDGTTQPKKQEIVEPLRSWLASLERDEVIAAMKAGERRRTRIVTRGWDIALEAIPKGTPGIHPNDRLIGIGPVGGGFVNDTDEARKAIVRKTSHYGDLNAPFVIALMPSSPFFSNEDVVGALYGSEVIRFHPDRPEYAELARKPDGAWSRGKGKVAGVLLGPRVLPWTVAKEWPRLWLNPHVSGNLDSLTVLPRAEVQADGCLVFSEASEPPARLLGLDSEWPGPGEPFSLT